MERKKNGIRNIKCGMFNQIITIVFPFLMRTILIKVLGAEYLGLNSLFTSILQVLNLTELGMGSAMVFGLYKPIAKNDTNKIKELQRIYQVLYRCIGTIIFILGIIILPFLKFFIKGSYPSDINIYIIYLLHLINTSVSYLMASYKGTLLTAHQRRDVIPNIGTVIHISLYIIQIICLVLLKNYYMYVIWIPIFSIIENIFIYTYTTKMYPKYKPTKTINRKELKKTFSKAKDLLGHKLSNVVTNSVDTIVISTFLGLSMVTIYNNYYYLMSAISGMLEIVYQGILAGIGNSLVSESKEKNRRDFERFSFINSWIVGWCSICFLCLYQPMISLWMGNEYMLSMSSVILLCIYFYVWKIRQTVLLYKDAAGLWDIDKTKPYIEIVSNLIINIILVNIIGINGVIVSTIVSMLFISLPWETRVFFKRYFNSNTYDYYKKWFKYLIITSVIAVITYYLCSFVKLSGILDLIVKGMVCAFVPNIIFCIIYQKDENFLYSIDIIRKTAKKENK